MRYVMQDGKCRAIYRVFLPVLTAALLRNTI